MRIFLVGKGDGKLGHVDEDRSKPQPRGMTAAPFGEEFVLEIGFSGARHQRKFRDVLCC